MTDTLVYLLDTNVLSEMMRPIPSGQVSDFLDRTRNEGHGISAVTVWEIEYGIRRLDDGKRRRDLKCMFDGVLAELFKNRIFPWEDQDAALCAEIMEGRRRADMRLVQTLDLAYLLADFDKLRGARFGMRFELAPLGPSIRLVVVIDVTQQQIVGAAMHDQTDIAIDAQRAEIRIARRIQLVELHTRMGRIKLQIERRGLNGLLLIAG